MLPRTVDVERHHIEAGIQRDSHACAIKNAIQDRFQGARFISVDLQSIKFSLPKHDKRYTFLTPKNAQAFIIAFDRGEDLKAMTFVLDKPVRVHQMRHDWVGNLDTLNRIRENAKRRRSHKGQGLARVRKYGIRMLSE